MQPLRAIPPAARTFDGPTGPPKGALAHRGAPEGRIEPSEGDDHVTHREHIEHIVWDWNGTLLADSDALIRATTDAFAQVGLSPVTPTRYRRHHQRPISAFYEGLAGRGLSPAEHEELIKHYLNSYTRRLRRARLEVGAIQALATWQARGGRQSLLSMHPHGSLQRLVQRHRVADFFTLVDGSTGAATDRKAPLLRRHLSRLGIHPDDVTMVGDTVDDANAAAEAGVRCVLFHSGDAAVHSRSDLELCSVPVVDRLTDALDLLHMSD